MCYRYWQNFERQIPRYLCTCQNCVHRRIEGRRPQQDLEVRHTYIRDVVATSISLFPVRHQTSSFFRSNHSSDSAIDREKGKSLAARRTRRFAIFPVCPPLHTLDLGYMVIGYLVFSDSWSIFGWSQFPRIN